MESAWSKISLTSGHRVVQQHVSVNKLKHKSLGLINVGILYFCCIGSTTFRVWSTWCRCRQDFLCCTRCWEWAHKGRELKYNHVCGWRWDPLFWPLFMRDLNNKDFLDEIHRCTSQCLQVNNKLNSNGTSTAAKKAQTFIAGRGIGTTLFTEKASASSWTRTLNALFLSQAYARWVIRPYVLWRVGDNTHPWRTPLWERLECSYVPPL